MVKTMTARVPDLVAAVKKHHPYDVPEVISAQLDGGNPDYYAWLKKHVSKE